MVIEENIIKTTSPHPLPSPSELSFSDILCPAVGLTFEARSWNRQQVICSMLLDGLGWAVSCCVGEDPDLSSNLCAGAHAVTTMCSLSPL